LTRPARHVSSNAVATKTLADLAEALKALARAYPEVHEDFPWGESAFKVAGKKVFLFMHANEAVLTLSLKLPDSRHAALMLPFTAPTGYGLGKSGWVTARLEAGAGAPMELLAAWVDESYRAVAPAKLVKAMDAARAAAPAVEARPAARAKKR
jgi:predicted DNA-binding protein (MmcQ/YjbR family)